MSNFELSILFFLQLAVILAACRIVGLIARYAGQPPVVNEMIAGVVLGPSLLGIFWPHLIGALPEWARFELFPKQSMTIIYAVAQLALACYMFLVGVEFRPHLIRKQIRSAASVSIAGIAAPFALGALIALYFAGDTRMFDASVSRAEAVLYLGAAMSITAFPMLARIIHEQGLAGTSLGTLALAAGSMDDAAAWCVLAIALASFTGNAWIAVLAIGGGLAYVVTVLLVVRPLLRPLGQRVERAGTMSTPMFSFVLMLAMLGSWYTDRIGIYAVFGAFILGTAMPRGRFADELIRLMMPLTTNLLLPLFFVYSGLNTKIGLIDTPVLWGIALLILLAACVGKGVACWAAARLNGQPPRESLAVGALMNARGLIELIILNIGYERGIITQTLFSIMVLMAIATTLMATPIFELVYGRVRDAQREEELGASLGAESARA